MVAAHEDRQNAAMEFRLFRGASLPSAVRDSAATLRQLALEFLVVVAGILAALGVDNWRQEREEARVAQEHLSALAVEIRNNVETIERIRDRALEPKRQNLTTVLRFLNEPDAAVESAGELLHAFARSTAASTPWLSDNQFQALQNSGDLRLLRDQDLAGKIAGAYAAPEVLLSQVRRIQGNYPAVVNELIPAHLQVEFSQLSGYVAQSRAPAIADDVDLLRALDAIRARRGELLRLARNEAAVATAQWYALTRLQHNFEAVLTELARREGAATPQEPPTPAR